ncbi:hypothetical protein SDC9_195977 [bioreactor metagenome]|uniref:Uncharacterized protein n=1 Tax=bioreactor metagenome TaxID=1076179 RepID=A0A645IB68_9ZZZZ
MQETANGCQPLRMRPAIGIGSYNHLSCGCLNAGFQCMFFPIFTAFNDNDVVETAFGRFHYSGSVVG